MFGVKLAATVEPWALPLRNKSFNRPGRRLGLSNVSDIAVAGRAEVTLACWIGNLRVSSSTAVIPFSRFYFQSIIGYAAMTKVLDVTIQRRREKQRIEKSTDKLRSIFISGSSTCQINSRVNLGAPGSRVASFSKLLIIGSIPRVRQSNDRNHLDVQNFV